MNEPTPDLRGAGPKDEQPTLLQWPHEAPGVVMQTGIKAVSDSPRLEVGPIPLTRIAHYELIKEVVMLAKRYGIATPYTSHLVVPDGPMPVLRPPIGPKGPPVSAIAKLAGPPQLIPTKVNV